MGTRPVSEPPVVLESNKAPVETVPQSEDSLQEDSLINDSYQEIVSEELDDEQGFQEENSPGPCKLL